MPLRRWLRRNLSFLGLLLFVFVCFFRLGTVRVPATADRESPPPQVEPVHIHFTLNSSVSRLSGESPGESPSYEASNEHTQTNIRLFIGIFTAAKGRDSKYGKRRAAIRDTWLPAAQSLNSTVTRFVVGNDDDAVIRGKLRAEMQQFPNQFMHIDMPDYSGHLTQKMASFLFTVSAAYDADWILKIDDDVYLSPLRVLPVLRQWDRVGADHTGCFRHGTVPPADAPLGGEMTALLLGARYPLHAYDTLYAVRGPIVRDMLRPNSPALRHYSSQGITLGAWLLAFNVTYFEDTRLCAPPLCRPAAVAYQHLYCGGLCEPTADMRDLHTRRGCTRPLDDDASPRYLPSQSGNGAFDAMAVP